MKLGSIQSRMNVHFFSSDHRPSEARIKRYTHNDPIMSAVPLTQDKCASKELQHHSSGRGTDGGEKVFEECG